MALPTLLAGETPDATKWADILSYLPQSAVAGSDQNATSNSTVFINDNVLAVAYASATRTYRFELNYMYQAGTTADLKICFTFANASMSMNIYQLDTSLAYVPNTFTGYASGTAIPLGGAGTGSPRAALIVGVFSTTGSGTLQVQFAQNVAAVETETRRSGSHLILQRLS
jgi:hypothetical protein